MEEIVLQHKKGNYADAFASAVKLLDENKLSQHQAISLVDIASNSLVKLNRQDELEAFLQKVVDKYGDNWKVVLAVVRRWHQDLPKYGYVVGEECRRGNKWVPGGRSISLEQYDRIKCLSMLQKLLPSVRAETNDIINTDQYFRKMCELLMHGNYSSMRFLTKIEEKPKYDNPINEFNAYNCIPVDVNGNPLFYAVPASWEDAKCDGERWRYIIKAWSEMNKDHYYDALTFYAYHLYQTFGLSDMQQIWIQSKNSEVFSFVLMLDTLTDEESISNFPTGRKRYTLPDEHNSIKLLWRVARECKDKSKVNMAYRTLGDFYCHRRQYEKALVCYRSSNLAEERIKSITGNWGTFEMAGTQVAGKEPMLKLLFRNASNVHLTAWKVDLLALAKAKIEQLTNPQNKQEEEKLIYVFDNLQEIVSMKNGRRFYSEKAAEWDFALTPAKGYRDVLQNITVPIKDAGVYVVEGNFKDGNTARTILHLTGIKLINFTQALKEEKKAEEEKPAVMPQPKNRRRPISMAGNPYNNVWQVLDAASGSPLACMEVVVDCLYRSYEKAKDGKIKTWHKHIARISDENGFVTIPTENGTDMNNANPPEGDVLPRNSRFGNLFFHVSASSPKYGYAWLCLWPLAGMPNRYDWLSGKRVYSVTDRPVYRPGDKVHIKGWNASFDANDPKKNTYANMTGVIFEIRDPRGKVVLEKKVNTDNVGGFEVEWTSGKDAALGSYRYRFNGGYLNGSFRVEEYKKPEYFVEIKSPEDTVKIGEVVKLELSAKYYFGAPVTDAKVNVRIDRSIYNDIWFPPNPWDWLYGNGFWWRKERYDWYPSWSRWGGWWNRNRENGDFGKTYDAQIGEDGKLTIEVDTSDAKKQFPDLEHRYTIHAEVVDKSRRMVAGDAEVLVSKDPFKVYCWAEQGFFNHNDTVTLHFNARTMGGKFVKGKREVRLYRVHYVKDGTPNEELFHSGIADSSEDYGKYSFDKVPAGQYRAAVLVTDEKGQTIEGATMFIVFGKTLKDDEYQCNPLELVMDKATYASGETAHIRIMTKSPSSTVMLVIEDKASRYGMPRVIRMEGKSAEVKLEIRDEDKPGFVVNAYTVHDGILWKNDCKVAIPPAERILKVEASAPAQVKPGEKNTLRVRVMDEKGAPASGVITAVVYDKSVDALAGAVHRDTFMEAFWRGSINHYFRLSSSRPFAFGNLVVGDDDVYPIVNRLERLVALYAANERLIADNSRVVVEEEGADYAADGMTMGGGFAGRRRMMGMNVAEAPMMMANAAPAPMKARAAAPEVKWKFEDTVATSADNGRGAQGSEPVVRKNFADTALWVGALEVDKDGYATLPITFPESLTTWKMKVWAINGMASVGSGEAEIVSNKELMVRLEAPRFFQERDEVVVSAIVNNCLKTAQDVTVSLVEDSGCLSFGDAGQKIRVESGKDARVDWRVKVVKSGKALIRVKAIGQADSDAMEQSFPVKVYGFVKQVSFSRMMQGNDSILEVTVEVPKDIRDGSAELTLNWSPSLAMSMLDALPYLQQYPYGCTEQTLNRFLPTVVTRKIIEDMGVSLEQIAKVRSGELFRKNIAELADDCHVDPVFDSVEFNAMLNKGLDKLLSMQCSDGGWGWFYGAYEHSSAHLTVQIVRGLNIAKQCGVFGDTYALERGINWLVSYQKSELEKLDNYQKYKNKLPKDIKYKEFADNLDALVLQVLVEVSGDKKLNRNMVAAIFRDKNNLSVYGKVLFALALQKIGDKDALEEVMQNIRQYLKTDDENQTAWLDTASRYWWYWYGDGIETQAAFLRLLVATEPKGDLAPRLVKYLLNNRKNVSYWRSTRDTAACIEAFAEYIKATGEDRPEQEIELFVDGKSQMTCSISAENLFSVPLSLRVKELKPGKHNVVLRRKGNGVLYFGGYVSYFSQEDDLTAAGLETKVVRRVYRLELAKQDVNVTDSRGRVSVGQKLKYERRLLKSDAEVKSGDLLEVELQIESKNDYEYMLVEDYKAAGLESVQQLSGYNGNSLGAYVEYRDTHVAMMVHHLIHGTNVISYCLRAEIPGKFTALPTIVTGMYAPELRSNADGFRIIVKD